MKNILLTTTALIAFAGAAAADGHTSFTWGGAATAGVAREGGSAAVAGTLAVGEDDMLTLALDYNAIAIGATVTPATVTPAALRTAIADDLATAQATYNDLVFSAKAAEDETPTVITDNITDLTALLALFDKVNGSSALEATGEFDTYAEVNITATGSVDLGNGVTVSGAVSVDAGTGYDLADDDGFDTAQGGISLDYIKVDGGTMGALTIDKNDIAHLVDGDDDGNGDIKYTNTFGNANIAFVMDTLKDTDETAVRSGLTRTDADGTVGDIVNVAAVPADVSWSAKVGYVINDSMSVYAAFDEEKAMHSVLLTP